jgi:hypothetical protein
MTTVKEYHWGAPQVIQLNQECTGNPKTCCWALLTNKVVNWMGRDHIQFNSMYVTTLKVAKDRHTLVSGPKFAEIAYFGNVETNRGGGGGGGTGGGGDKCSRGGWCPPSPKVDDDDSSSNESDR